MSNHQNSPNTTSQAAPIWFAALTAARCEAINGLDAHSISWSIDAGKAVYNNSSSEPEFVEPFGLRLDPRDTLMVSWRPGDTEYTFEVSSAPDTRAVTGGGRAWHKN